MEKLAKEFHDLFRGYEKAYGTFRITNTKETKQSGRAITIRGEVTLDLWTAHLRGICGIGIVPLLDDNKVLFSAIDIDDYTLDFGELNNSIQENNLPLTFFRSKSGGAHLYLFLEEPLEAKLVREALSRMCDILGFGGVEVFPKQDRRDDPDSIGNWLNMPYFFAEGTSRYAVDNDGNAIPHTSIIDYIKRKKTNAQALEHYVSKEKTTVEIKEPLKGGPPCLNTLIISGFPPNTRNNTLFNLGVYAKKSCTDGWEDLVEEYNRQYIDPPLKHSEVGAILKSLVVKDYNYKCKDTPISAVCNKPRCLVCQFGVRPSDELPKLGKLTKIQTDPPVWQVEVQNGGRLELTTEELQSPRLFQRKCMEVLNIMPPNVKGEQWREIVQALMENTIIIDIPDDSSPRGRLYNLLWEFLEGRVQAKKREEILSGKPWENNSIHYWSMNDFMRYLERLKFTEIRPNKILSHIKEMNGIEHVKWSINARFVNLWSLPVRKNE
jgi:hypothetical protein